MLGVVGLLCGCARAVDLPRVETCAVGLRSAMIANRGTGQVAAAGCVLYAVRDGWLCYRALHGEEEGVLFAEAGMPVTAVAADGGSVAFLYRAGDAPALGRIAAGRLTLSAGSLPDRAAVLYCSAGELFCADAAGQLWRLTDGAPCLLPVGAVWAMTADAVIFAEGAELRACLREDGETITALSALPGGGSIAAIAVDQATEEETRIFVLDGDGQVWSFADGGWTMHGAPHVGASAITVAGADCIVTDPDGVWRIEPFGGETRIGEGEFAMVEDEVVFAPFGW